MKKPIKIAFDATPLLANKTGVAYYTERLALSIAQKYPDDVELVGFYYNFLNRKQHEHLSQLPNLRYRNLFPLIPSKVVFQLRRFGIEFPIELMLREHVDFVLYPNFLGFPSVKHVPSAPVIHDLTYIDLPEYVSAKLRRDLVRFVPKQIKRSKFVVTVSEFSKQKIIENYNVSADKVVVTPIPPETPVLYTEAQRQAVLQKLGITRPFLLFLGTIEPRKNITSLIDAHAKLPQSLQERYPLVIVGRIGWNCEKEIAKLKEAKEQGRNVIHLGYIDDEARAVLYQSAHFFVSASYYEGFGMPVLEAMSYGTPCAVSDIAVFHEVAGDAATYFDQEDPAHIASTLKYLLNNPDTLHRQIKLSKVQAASFSWNTVASELFVAIQEHLEN